MADHTCVPEYNLNIEPKELVAVMKGMGNSVKWPRKAINPDPKCDTTKWCKFRSEHGHNTPDCITLRLEVTNLLKKGHFQDLLFDKGKNTLTIWDNR